MAAFTGTKGNIIEGLKKARTKAWQNQDVTHIPKGPDLINNEALSAISYDGATEVDLIKLSVADAITIPGNLEVTGTLTIGATAHVSAIAITNAEIKALAAAPKELVAAPAAGQVLEFVSAVLLLDYGTNVLSTTDCDLAIRYNNGSGKIVSEVVQAVGFIDAAADTVAFVRADPGVVVAGASCAAKSLVLDNIGTGEIGGNAGLDTLMRVKIVYRLHATGF